jgi:hypothetical protein
MDSPLTLLYTHNLRGDLSLLPRLHTFIKQLKALEVDDEDDVMLCLVQPQTRRTLLIDLGGSCAPDVWHCAVTGGRSTLMVLDAMGYAAASAAGLTPEAREKLLGAAQLGLVDAAHRWESDGVIAATSRQPDPGTFQLVLQPGAELRLDGRVVYPRALNAGQVGVAHFSFALGQTHLIAESVLTLPPGTAPDATIAGMVDFVTSEARHYQRRQGG